MMLLAVGGAACAGGGDSATPTQSSLTAPSVSSTPAAEAGATMVFQYSGRVNTVETDRADVTVLTDETPVGQEHPDWSPDGSRIVFETEFDQLWTVAADGTDVSSVLECDDPCQVVQDGAWSPDGSEIAFVMVESEDGTTTSRSAIMALDVATGSTRLIHEDTSGTVWLFHPRWSGDGRSIVFEQDTWASDLLSEESLESVAVATVAVDGPSPPTTIATWPGPLAGGDAPAPDWSPVDDLLVFSRDGNLFTVIAAGGDPVQVTDFDGLTEHAVQPTFTPEGDGIVFTYVTGRWDVDDSPSAALISLDGSGFDVLAQGVAATHPRLRPD